jgi:hypothetical protein
MRSASKTLARSFCVCMLAVTACGGDDSTGGTMSSTGAAGSGAGGAATGTGSGGSGGATSGSGGGSADGGNGCPASQPAASTPCNLDHDCTYGMTTCSCVDMNWTCSGGGGDGGSCPMADPDEGETCFVQGLMCTYGGGLICTCNLQSGWSCVVPRRQSMRMRMDM